MKITKGPMLQRFADLIGVQAPSVIEWVNAYVNEPEQFHNREFIEATEKARFASIREYIEQRVNEVQIEVSYD